ncbi:MAG: hypothetical protein PHN22_03145 [Candidatus ainarchaeum sp.]|nr:hypothetical protein [Candidatus ainarchaeum sp.]
MKKILFTNTYSFTPMVGAITKINPEEIYLIIDKKPDEHQKEAKEKLKNTFKHIKFKEIKTSVYEVYEIAKEIIKEIDKVYNEDINEIYIEILLLEEKQSLLVLCLVVMQEVIK